MDGLGWNGKRERLDALHRRVSVELLPRDG